MFINVDLLLDLYFQIFSVVSSFLSFWNMYLTHLPLYDLRYNGEQEQAGPLQISLQCLLKLLQLHSISSLLLSPQSLDLSQTCKAEIKVLLKHLYKLWRSIFNSNPSPAMEISHYLYWKLESECYIDVPSPPGKGRQSEVFWSLKKTLILFYSHLQYFCKCSDILCKVIMLHGVGTRAEMENGSWRICQVEVFR